MSAESTLVRVDITVVSEGTPEPAEIADKRLPNYRPKIIETFPSTGAVIDDRGHILTFLGYSWVDCDSPNRQVEVTTADGKKYKAKLIGIDQSIGTAVVRCLTSVRLVKTPLCVGCEIRGGATVVAPLPNSPGAPQFYQAQILSVGRGTLPLVRKDGWVVTINRPLPGIGEPILDTDHRVLGFVAGQDPSPGAGNGAEAVVYLISQLLGSAQKILSASGDIRTGWLGVYVDSESASDKGVVLGDVIPEGPAEKAGLKANDTITKWDGKEVRDAPGFIQMVQEARIGSTARIEFLRQGKRLTTTALIETRKPQEKSAGLPFDFRQFITFPGLSQPGGRSGGLFMGMAMVQVTPQLAEFFQVPGRTGLLVSSVEPDTPFSQAGVLVGDVIIAVDGQPVQDSSSLLKRFQSIGRGGHLLLKLVRNGTEHITTVRLPGQSPAAKNPK